MSLHSWLQNLRFALAPRRGQRRNGRPGSLRAAKYPPSLEVLEHRLTPSFMWAESLAIAPPGVEWAPPPPLLADFTSDGILDRLGGNCSCNLVAVEPGLGDGSFGDPIISALWSGNLAVADFNGDGRLDVVSTVAGYGVGEGAFGVELGRGDGTFYGFERIDGLESVRKRIAVRQQQNHALWRYLKGVMLSGDGERRRVI